MIFFDENMGKNVPLALSLVGKKLISSKSGGWLGLKDPQMLHIIGPSGYLLVSCNKRMLLPGEERDLYIKLGIGGVFLTDGEEYLDRQLALWLRKWTWLEELDRVTQRPFAWFLAPSGHRTQTHKVKGIELAIL